MTIKFSLKEAAVITGLPERDIRRAIEAGSIRPETISFRHAPCYRLRVRDLLYLKLIADFPFALSQEDKYALRDVVEAKQKASGRWRRGTDDVVIEAGSLVLRVELKSMQQWIARRLRTFQRGRHRIVSNAGILGGEPVFEGTRIPLNHVVGLFRKGVPIDDVREDYPSLSSEDLEYARLIAPMKPDPSRPRGPLVMIRGGKPVTNVRDAADRRASPAG